MTVSTRRIRPNLSYIFSQLAFMRCLMRAPGGRRTMAAALSMAHAQTPVPLIRAVRPDVPDGLVDVLNRMLAKSPDDRFATYDELIAAIEAAHPELPLWRYDAGHAFVAPSDRHEDSARLAMLLAFPLLTLASLTLIYLLVVGQFGRRRFRIAGPVEITISTL